MRFNDHSRLTGKHAFLSASQYAWTNYTPEKLEDRYRTSLAAMRGTELHDFAAEAIRLGIKLPRSPKTLNLYVNDCIGFRMTPEQVLHYSDNAFGTADAISFNKNLLRIFDLKTGVTPASFRQLEIYVAFFCLEYQTKPAEIEVELRLYQNDEILIHEPDLEDIMQIMSTVVAFDKKIDQLKMEALS